MSNDQKQKSKKPSSKYADKVKQRRRVARKMGLRPEATWPEIWWKQEEE